MFGSILINKVAILNCKLCVSWFLQLFDRKFHLWWVFFMTQSAVNSRNSFFCVVTQLITIQIYQDPR